MRGAESAAVGSSTVPADSRVTPPPPPPPPPPPSCRILSSFNPPGTRLNPQPSTPTPTLACSKVWLCIMPIAQIAIGAVHLHNCPREPYIPIYLIVMGVFGLALALLSCLPCARQAKDQPMSALSLVYIAWKTLTSVFLFCWFVVGNVWIYSIYEPNYNKNTTSVEPYCDRTLYLFAFWTTNFFYIVLGLVCICRCCVLGLRL